MRIIRKPLNPVIGQVSTGLVILDTVKIEGFFVGGISVIRSILLVDKANRGQPLDIIFLRTNVSVGTAGQAVSIINGDTDEIYGIETFNNYKDMVNSKIQHKEVYIPVQTFGQSDDLWVAAVCRGGTPNYNQGLRLTIGVE